MVLSGCIYFEAGGGGALPSRPSHSSTEASVAWAVGFAADVRTGPFARGLRLAGGIGTTYGAFTLERGDVSYYTGVGHLRIDQTFWADAPMYVRWMVAAELGGAGSWDDELTEELEPLEGSAWAVLTGPTITIGFEGEAERERLTDGSVHFTLAFHYGVIETSRGTVAAPGLQVRFAFDYDIGAAMMDELRDGMN